MATMAELAVCIEQEGGADIAANMGEAMELAMEDGLEDIAAAAAEDGKEDEEEAKEWDA